MSEALKSEQRNKPRRRSSPLGRFYRLTGLIFVLLLGMVSAVRVGGWVATPRLNYLLTNPDGSPCAAPCILGITPGQMSYREAVSILRHHPLVAPYSLNEAFCRQEYGWCDFKLRGFGNANGLVYARNREDLHDTKVVEVTIRFMDNSDSLTLGDFVAAFGAPQYVIPNPNYSCCAPNQVGVFTEKLNGTYGFLLYFPDHGISVEDRAQIEHGLYRLHPTSAALNISVARPFDVCSSTQKYLDHWYGFTTLIRYFNLTYKSC